MYPVEERREGVGREGSGNGVELGGGESESVSVGELVEAVDDSVLEVLSRPGALGRGGAAERGSSGVGHCWDGSGVEVVREVSGGAFAGEARWLWRFPARKGIWRQNFERVIVVCQSSVGNEVLFVGGFLNVVLSFSFSFSFLN